MKIKQFLTKYCIPIAVVFIVWLVCQMMHDNMVFQLMIEPLLVPTCIYICMALSLNLVVGISGELSLGHAGFMSIGAFTGVIISGYLGKGLGVDVAAVRIILALIGGGVVAGIAGALIGIPVLRLRGDYLAIVTLAFGEIIRNIMQCIYASVDGTVLHLTFGNPEVAGTMLINGPLGAVKASKLATITVSALLLVFTLVVVLNLVHSRSGRAIMAIRDNRISAETTGLNVTKYKMMAFVISAVLAGMAGALYGMNYTTFAAKKFDFNTSINILVFVVLGGIGNMSGCMLSTTVLYVLPEMLRDLQRFRMLGYAIVLILVMLFTNSAELRGAMTKGVSFVTDPVKKALHKTTIDKE